MLFLVHVDLNVFLDGPGLLKLLDFTFNAITFFDQNLFTIGNQLPRVLNLFDDLIDFFDSWYFTIFLVVVQICLYS